MEKSNISKPDLTIKRLNNAVILPDGTKNEPMGSGYITGLLGVGGMANVYEIWNPQLEISRAVKLLHPNYTPEAKQRFETEIKITARLQHPNIVEIHYVGEWNGLPYIEMERINGLTLDDMVAIRGALPVEVCTAIGITVCRALRFAHNQEYVIYGKTYTGVIHRDLKPSNIMITYKGILKLMDFGIARPTDASLLTTDGSILGTIQYLSPEQLEGNDADIRSDIYSIGTVLYELITGQKAFPEHNVSKLMMSKVKNEFVSLDNFDFKTSVKIKKLVHRCMMHNPDKRFPNTTELLSELTKVHKSVSSQTPEQVLRIFINEMNGNRVVLTVKKQFPFKIVSIVAGVILCVIILFKLSNKSEQQQMKSPVIATGEKNNLTSLPAIDSSVFGSVQTVSPHQKKVVRRESLSFEDLSHSKSPDIVSEIKDIRSPGIESGQNRKVENVKDIKSSAVISFIDSLRASYGTEDLGIIIERTLESRAYTRVLQIFDTIASKGAVSDRVWICKARALRFLNDKTILRKVLTENDIQDGEFILEKARMRYNDGKSAECLDLLAVCSRTPAKYTDGKMFRLECLYLTAKCKSALFDQFSDVKNKNDALGSWFDVKAELQTAQDHKYFKEAESEMQRITSKVTVSQR